MKIIFKIVSWLKRETWWRKHYKRVNICRSLVNEGRCLYCDAANGSLPSKMKCNIVQGRDCPCKYNQCLRFK